MLETNTDISELSAAVEEMHARGNRRRSPRFRQAYPAELSLWLENEAGHSVRVLIEDFSTTGVGIRHTGHLNLGAKYLLTLPRADDEPLSAVLTVVRCDESDGGCFTSELTPAALLETVTELRRRQALAATPIESPLLPLSNETRVKPQFVIALAAFAFLCTAIAVLAILL